MRERLWRDLSFLLHAVHVHSESQVFAPGISNLPRMRPASLQGEGVRGETRETAVQLVVHREDLRVSSLNDVRLPADLVEVVRDTDGLLTKSQIAGDSNTVFTDHGDDGTAVQGHRGPLRVNIWIRECMTGAVLTILVGLSEELVGHVEAGRDVRAIHACAPAFRRSDDGAVCKGVIESSRDTSSLINAMLTLNTDPTTMMRRRPRRRSPKPQASKGYARPQTEPIIRSSHLIHCDLH